MAESFFDDADSVPVKESFFDDHDSTPIAAAPVGNASKVNFGDVVSESIPVVGPAVSKLSSGTIALINAARGKGRLPDLYEQEKAQHAADMAAYADKNPVLNTVSGLAGSSMIPVPGGGLTAQVVKNAGIAAADAYVKDENPLLAGGIAGGLTGALGAVGKLSAPSLREYAERRAVKAAGAMTKDMRDLNKAGFLQSTGRELLDQKIVTAGASLEDVIERSKAAKERAGESIGDAIGKVDDLVSTANHMIDTGELFSKASTEEKEIAKKYLAENFQFNMKNIGDRIESELIQPGMSNPLLKGEMTKLAGISEGFRAQGPQTLQQGLGIKGSQRRITNFNSDTIPQGYKQDIYKIIKEELESSVSKTEDLARFADFTGKTPEQAKTFLQTAKKGLSGEAEAINPADAYRAANKQYATMANVEEMANKRFGAAQSNRENSLTDTIAEVGGLVHGGIHGAMAMGAINKGIRRYGSSVGAVGADKLADLLEKTPESFGKFAAALQQAAQRGNTPLAITHYMLSQQNPEYREQTQSIFGDK